MAYYIYDYILMIVTHYIVYSTAVVCTENCEIINTYL